MTSARKAPRVAPLSPFQAAPPSLARSAPVRGEIARLIAQHGLFLIRCEVEFIVERDLLPHLQRFPCELREDPHFERAERKLVRLHVRQFLMDTDASPTANRVLRDRIRRVWDELYARDCEPVGTCPDCGVMLWRQRENTGRCKGRETQNGFYAGIVFHPPNVDTPRSRRRMNGVYVPSSDIRGAVCLSPERVAAVKAAKEGC